MHYWETRVLGTLPSSVPAVLNATGCGESLGVRPRHHAGTKHDAVEEAFVQAFGGGEVEWPDGMAITATLETDSHFPS